MDNAGIVAGWALGVGLVVMFALYTLVSDYRKTKQRDTQAPHVFTWSPDIWELQRHQMLISGQHLPDRITLTPGTVLYLALTMEELAETAGVIFEALSAVPCMSTQQALVAVNMESASTELREMSKTIRRNLSRMQWPEAGVPLTERQAADLADGATDSTVTIAGLANATGIPGSACYQEVSSSNFSKANPLTGMIEKDSSGKWIKGENYAPPDLLAVLRREGAL